MEHGPSDFKVGDAVWLRDGRVGRVVWKGIDKCEVEVVETLAGRIARFMVEYRLLKLVDKLS